MSTPSNDQQNPDAADDAAAPDAPSAGAASPPAEQEEEEREEKHEEQQPPQPQKNGVASVTGGIAPFNRQEYQPSPHLADVVVPRRAGLKLERGSLMSMRIPDNRQVRQDAKDVHGVNSLEHRVLKFIHGKKVQTILASLLLLDVLIIFTELMLWSMYPHCSIIVRDGISCCPATTTTIHNETAAAAADHAAEESHGERYLLSAWKRFLSSGGGEEGDDDSNHLEEDFCASGLEPDLYNTIGCDEHKWYRVHTAEVVLFGLTMTILSIFMLELVVLMLAIRPWIFFRHFFYALDFIVVSGSIVLESVFHSLGNDVAQTYAGFLIVIRLWRFVRIGHGITEIISEVSNEKYQQLLAYTEELESMLLANNFKLPTGPVRHHNLNNGKSNPEDILESLEEQQREKIRKKNRELNPVEEEADEE
jgi:hypothetical protein